MTSITTSESGTDGIRHIVIVGGGPAAHRLTEALVDRDPAEVRITVVTEEIHVPYDRVGLSKRFTSEDPLRLGKPELWEDSRVRLRTGAAVTAIDTTRRAVTIDDAEALTYDELVLATGSSAPRPPIDNADHIAVYRTIDDVDWLRRQVAELTEQLGRAPRCTVIGGGLLGLEAAGGLKDLGAEVTVVHSQPWLMNAQLDEYGGRTLNRLLEDQGFRLHMGERPTALSVTEPTSSVGAETPGCRYTLQFSESDDVAADLVVSAIGIAARDELAVAAGLQCAEAGGVEIDQHCATSADHVWAIGEVASFHGTCMGLVAPANAMAEVVADRICGGDAVFEGFDTATKLKLAGMDVANFGDCFAQTPGALEVVFADAVAGVYQKLVVTDDARTLLGGVFVGDATPYTALRPLLNRELPAEPGAFLSASGGQDIEMDLPDDAQICSCKDVSAAQIRSAVAGDGEKPPCADMGCLKACTGVGTQCGSCIPLAKKIMEKQMLACGMEVSTALCEHFTQSRSELYQAVQAAGLRSFTAIVNQLGSPPDSTVNFGCDVCKPAIASILAAVHDDYVLDGGRGALQDTNDRALANMQKDGTYSVVPRVPAGEITPAKLKVIAEVAEDFDLYTKITGAQRIDMFGARLDQLPAIWRRLVEAGFESGQAYGKALRNVKSCVGSTWCRYGVQDSVAMAIQLELRYRGLRSPHKLKFGVSGCARECAEARGKDVGVIATEHGWNMYIGGNGGATPAHAQLFAKDLDDDTLLRYIDRYIAYYVRTADRLQRTARWIEEMPQGIDHLYDVIVNDSLGIAADLERVIAEHVEHYEDEWAATLRDPQRLRRFRSFVNAPETPDTELAYVVERGQRRPASDAEIIASQQGTDGPVLVHGPRIPLRRPDESRNLDRAEAGTR